MFSVVQIVRRLYLSLVAVPSRSPDNFTLVVRSSISITASWQLPPVHARNGIIRGFKLFYKKKGSIDPPITLTIRNSTSRYAMVTGLNVYTEYEFQILAFTSVGDGLNSSLEVKRTAEEGKRSGVSELNVSIDSKV